MTGDSPILCPSGRCEPGARLLGMLRSDGLVGFVPQPLTVDEAFAETVRRQGNAELRYRFANPCAEEGCENWRGKCLALGQVMRLAKQQGLSAKPPDCSIKDVCRWIRQAGEKACRVCAFSTRQATTESVP